MRSKWAWFLLSGVVLAHASPAQAAKFGLAAGEGKTLVIDMPAGWRAHTSSAEGRPVTALAFSPAEGADFKVLITALPLPSNPAKGPPTLQDLRESVEAAAGQAEAQAVETHLTTVDLIGPDVTGAYFQATDRAPPPGEFEHLTQGVLKAGDVVLTFTVLANDDAPGGPDTIRAQALAALRAGTIQP